MTRREKGQKIVYLVISEVIVEEGSNGKVDGPFVVRMKGSKNFVRGG